MKYERKSSKVVQFTVGDWVYTPMKQEGVSAKLQHFWRGPLYIMEQTSPVNYRLESVRGNARVQNVVHASRI